MVYLFFMLAMALVFVNLDDIVGSLCKVGDNDLRKVDFSQYEAVGKDPVYFRMDPVSYAANDFETVSFSGECFAETEDDNSEKTITVLLRGENVCYASERRSSWGVATGGSAKGFNHSFARQVSLLPVKDGTYEIWLYDRENDTNYGLVNTKQIIIKDRDGIRQTERAVSAPVAEDELDLDGICCLDSVKEFGTGWITLEGWIFQENVETEGQTVYLRLDTRAETKYILCAPLPRDGVAEVYGSEKYDYCGFQAYVERAWIGDGPLEISLILENETGFHGGNRVYTWDPTAEEPLQPGIAKSPLLKICPFDPDDVQPGLGHLDLVQKENGQITVSGWAAAENQETGNQTVYLEIQTENGPRYAKCSQVLRTGVGDALGSRLYDHSGYTCSIAVENLPSSGFDFQVFVENEAGVYTDGVLHHYDTATEDFQ